MASPMALIIPAKTHPDVIVFAIAARDKTKAEAFAEKYGIPQVLDDYQGK
jgi:predicted dehydrogenase